MTRLSKLTKSSGNWMHMKLEVLERPVVASSFRTSSRGCVWSSGSELEAAPLNDATSPSTRLNPRLPISWSVLSNSAPLGLPWNSYKTRRAPRSSRSGLALFTIVCAPWGACSEYSAHTYALSTYSIQARGAMALNKADKIRRKESTAGGS